MYDNIGGKIKGLAKAFFVVESIAAIIGGMVVIVGGNGGLAVFVGILTVFFGPIVAWVSSWVIYGFGELIDKASDIEYNTRSGEIKAEAQAKADNERREKLERLRSQGLITEEEYQQALSKQQ